jgi:uncharacterized protein
VEPGRGKHRARLTFALGVAGSLFLAIFGAGGCRRSPRTLDHEHSYNVVPPMRSTPDARAAELIATLDLQPHPEGGFYREVFRSNTRVLPADERGPRAALTTIYFLLTADDRSRWHRVSSDEVWHLYEGGPLELFELDTTSHSLQRHRLAPVGQLGAPLATIAAGNWQAARSLGPYALMGCTVGPGFDFADFDLLAGDAAAAASLRDTWPELASLL